MAPETLGLPFLPRPWKFVPRPGRYRPDTETLQKIFEPAGLRADLQNSNEVPPAWLLGSPEKSFAETARKSLAELLAGISDPRIREQAYALEVAESGAAACAGGPAGLFYAAVTLLHLIGPDRSLPGVSLQDRPALPYRAVLLDVSRGRVPRLSALQDFVDLIAILKFNQLTFNIEHTFACPQHPEIGQGHDPITPEEMKELVDYAEQRHVDVIPFQQSFGHLHYLLEVPAYQHLAYDPEKRWSLDPRAPESYDLLRDLYRSQLAVTRSKFFHVGCDEPFDLIKRFDSARFSGRSLGQVVRDHLLKLHQIITGQGKTMMAWADPVIAHPEILPDLPDDLVLLHWMYGTGNLEGPEHYRPSLEILANSKRPFYVCTATWSFMKIFPDLAVMKKNHDSFVPEAKTAGAQGLMATIWGDMGHMNLPGLEPYPLAYAARHGWEDRTQQDRDFDRALAWTVYRDPSGSSAELSTTLDQVNSLLHGPAGMAGVGFLLLFSEPLTAGVLSPEVADLEQCASDLAAAAWKAQLALTRLETGRAMRRSWWRDAYLAADQMEVLAKKLELIALLKTQWDSTRELVAKENSPETMAQALALARDAATGCEEIAMRIAQVFMRLEHRWLMSSKPSDLAVNQERYRKLTEAWLARAQEFSAYAEDLANAKPLPPLLQILLRSPSAYAFNPLQEMGLLGLI